MAPKKKKASTRDKQLRGKSAAKKNKNDQVTTVDLEDVFETPTYSSNQTPAWKTESPSTSADALMTGRST